MIEVSDAYKAAIYDLTRFCKLSLVIEDIEYTADDISSLEIVETVNDSSGFSLGSVCSASLKFSTATGSSLNTKPKEWWKNQKITVKAGIAIANDTIEWVPCGVFWVSESQQEDNKTYTVSAQDAIWKLSDSFETTIFEYPCTVGNMFETLCNYFGAEIKSLDFPNADKQLKESSYLTAKGITALSYIAQAAGCFARATRDGKISLDWYKITDHEIGDDQCYSTKLGDYISPQITKLSIKTEEGDLGVSIGEDGYEYEIINNPLLYANPEAVLEGIFNNVEGFQVSDAAIIARGNPAIEAGDIITLNIDGEKTPIVIMQHKIVFNGGLASEYTEFGADPKEQVLSIADEAIRVLNKRANVIERDLNKTLLKVESVTKELQATLTSTITQYASSTSSETAPDASSAWFESMPDRREGEYIWQRTVSTYADGTKRISDAVCLSSATAGKDGRGILSVKSLYGLSASEEQEPTEWTETAPVMSTEKPCLWSYEVTTYTDETTSESVPHVIGIYGKGKDGITYTLAVTPQILNRSYEGVLRPDTISINSTYRTGDDIMSQLYAGRFKIEESADGETYRAGYTSEIDETGHDYTVTGTDTRLLKVSLYAAGGSVMGANKLLAQQTVSIVQDGTPSTLLTIRSDGGTIFHNGKGEIRLCAEGTIGNTVITEASYQWYKDEKVLEGETEKTYAAAASTIGSKPAVYRCDMTYQGKIYSDNITLENKVEFVVSGTAPKEPAANDVWLDKSEGGRILKYWNGTDWIAISDYKGELTQIRDEQSQLLQEASGIVLEHLSSYSEKSDLAELRESILTQLSVLEGKIEMRFETAQDSAVQIGDALEVFKTLFYTSISMTEEGITIGKSDSPFKSLFANDRLSFTQDGAEVAYISNNKLYITDAEITGSLYLTNGDYRSRWYVDNKGNVCLQ